MSAAFKQLGWVAAGYLALFVGITWPLVLSPASLVVCKAGDGYFDMLLFWYAAHGELMKPVSYALLYPLGVPIGAEQAYWLVPYMSVPLQWLMPLPAVFNLLACIFFVATAASVYVLARDLGTSAPAAFTAGALLVLSPAYQTELAHGIPENLTLQWMIGFVLLARRAALAPTRFNVYGSGVCMTLAWLSSWYVGALAALCLPLTPVRRIWPGLLLAAVLLAWPLGRVVLPSAAAATATRSFGHRFDTDTARAMMYGSLPMSQAFAGRNLANAAEDEYVRMSTAQILSNSADYGGMLARFRPGRLRDTLPGLLLVGMAVLGAATARRRALPWTGMTLFFLYLSVGPMMLWQGDIVCATPTAWLYEHVPMVARMRPIRFVLGETVCLAVLSAFAFPRLRRPVGAWLLAALLVALAWIEVDLVHVAQYKLILTDARIPAAYATLADEHPEQAVIDVPLMPYDLRLGQAMYYQTRHRHPMLNYNFVSIDSLQHMAELARSNTLIAALLGEPGELRRADFEDLSARGFRYLLLHTRMPQPDSLLDRPFLFDSTLYDDLATAYGPPREFPDDGVLVFDMQAMRPEAFDASGKLHAQGYTRSGKPSVVALAAGPQAGAHFASMFPPYVEGTFQEVRGWMRGRDARVRVMQGSRTVAQSPPGTDDWTWFRIPLEGVQQSGTLEVWVDMPGRSAEFGGALLAGVAMWRSRQK